MVELRWAIPAETTTKAPRLQYRQCSPVISFGDTAGWSDWQDVPFVVVQPEPQKPAASTLNTLCITRAAAEIGRDAKEDA